MGLPCAISVTGYSLASTSSLLIIDGGSTCGDASAATIAAWDSTAQTPAVSYVDWTSVAASSVGADAAEATYDFGTPVEGVPGPVYKICWSHESLDPAAHLVELGVFTKNGPDTATFTCYIGSNCDLSITGYGFEADNELVIVYGPFDQINGAGSSGAGCGDAYFTPLDGAGVMPASLAYPATTYNNTHAFYSIGQAFGAVGDHYKLCWAHDPSVIIPAALPQFKVTVNARFNLAYPVEDDTVWEQGGTSSPSGFLGKKESVPTYHDDETGLDVVFQPPGA